MWCNVGFRIRLRSFEKYFVLSVDVLASRLLVFSQSTSGKAIFGHKTDNGFRTA